MQIGMRPVLPYTLSRCYARYNSRRLTRARSTKRATKICQAASTIYARAEVAVSRRRCCVAVFVAGVRTHSSACSSAAIDTRWDCCDGVARGCPRCGTVAFDVALCSSRLNVIRSVAIVSSSSPWPTAHWPCVSRETSDRLDSSIYSPPVRGCSMDRAARVSLLRWCRLIRTAARHISGRRAIDMMRRARDCMLTIERASDQTAEAGGRADESVFVDLYFSNLPYSDPPGLQSTRCGVPMQWRRLQNIRTLEAIFQSEHRQKNNSHARPE